MKKSIAVLLSVLLIFIVFLTACSTPTDTSPDASSTPKPSASPTTNKVTLSGYEFSTEPVTLTGWTDWPQSMGNWGDDMVSQWITETCGVSFDMEYATTGTSEELNLMLLSGNELPDIIITGGTAPVAKTLVREKYVSALDELANEYFPAFMELLPGGMYEIYQEDDGHLYRTADWYADSERIAQFRQENNLPAGAGDQTLVLNKTIWEELGSPEINTLMELRDYFKQARDAHPEITVPLMLYYMDWTNVKDAVNFFYRLNGGQTWVYDDGDGTLKLCLRDERYKAALKFLNDLFQDGTLTENTLNMDFDSKNNALSGMDVIAYVGQDWEWFSKVPNGDQMTSPCWPIKPPVAEGLNRSDLKLRDGNIGAIGGNTAVFITDGAKNAARAIEYLAFEFTDEAQLNNRFGIEGVTWERNPNDGMVMWTDEYNDYVAANGWTEMSKKYGANNSTHSWFTTIWATVQESQESLYPIQKYNGTLVAGNMTNERLFEISRIIDDDDIQFIFDQLLMLVQEQQMKCITAASDTAFEDAYREYITTAESMDIKSLEAYYTQKYQKWQALGVK
jgi:putative aldouronate transport system substrate-binding protein